MNFLYFFLVLISLFSLTVIHVPFALISGLFFSSPKALCSLVCFHLFRLFGHFVLVCLFFNYFCLYLCDAGGDEGRGDSDD